MIGRERLRRELERDMRRELDRRRAAGRERAMTREMDQVLDLLNALRWSWTDAIAHGDMLAVEVLAPMLDQAEERWRRVCERKWRSAVEAEAAGEPATCCGFGSMLD